MAKTQASSEVADSNEPAATEADAPVTTKTIAEWTGSETSPRLDGPTARSISRKEAKDGLIMDLTKDLRWGNETAYRQDITDEPESFKEWLRKSGEFKVTEE